MDRDTYLLTEEAIGFAGRLLDDHDGEIEITAKVRTVIADIYKQLLSNEDDEAYILGSDNNIGALESCLCEPMSAVAKEAVDVLYEAACAICNGW